MKTLGYILFFGGGLVMWLAEMIHFYQWWNFTGLVIGILIPPIAELFPFVYWIKVGLFPIWYFVIWGIGIAGIILASVTGQNE